MQYNVFVFYVFSLLNELIISYIIISISYSIKYFAKISCCSLPENPPNVETHDIQPEEGRQEGELDDKSWK